MALILIGYWTDGPDSPWPDPRDHVDPDWDAVERDMVAQYLQHGVIARACMGWSPCRICGRRNGSLSMTDHTYLWPEGLAHYVVDHLVRLPGPFVEHVDREDERLPGLDADATWWRSLRGSPPRTFLDTLAPIAAEWGGRWTSPASLLQSWENLVEQVEDGYGWTVYELDDEVSVRGRLEQLLSDPRLDGFAERRDIAAGVTVLDERFRRACRTDVHRRGPHEPWWHRLVPRRVGEELARDLRDLGIDPQGPGVS